MHGTLLATTIHPTPEEGGGAYIGRCEPVPPYHRATPVGRGEVMEPSIQHGEERAALTCQRVVACDNEVTVVIRSTNQTPKRNQHSKQRVTEMRQDEDDEDDDDDEDDEDEEEEAEEAEEEEEREAMSCTTLYAMHDTLCHMRYSMPYVILYALQQFMYYSSFLPLMMLLMLDRLHLISIIFKLFI